MNRKLLSLSVVVFLLVAQAAFGQRPVPRPTQPVNPRNPAAARPTKQLADPKEGEEQEELLFQPINLEITEKYSELRDKDTDNSCILEIQIEKDIKNIVLNLFIIKKKCQKRNHVNGLSVVSVESYDLEIFFIKNSVSFFKA